MKILAVQVLFLLILVISLLGAGPSKCLVSNAYLRYDKAIENMLSQNVDVNMTDKSGTTAIMVASWAGRLPLVKVLLKYKPKLNLKGSWGWNAVLGAAKSGKLEITKMLFEHGARVSKDDLRSKLLIIVVGCGGNKEIIKLLLSHSGELQKKRFPSNDQITKWSEGNLKFFVQMILDSGSDVNMRDMYGDSVLAVATSNGDEEVVKLLLQYKPDLEAKNRFGDTAIDCAVVHRKLDILQILVNNGGDSNSKNIFGKNCLMLAASRGDVEIVKFLVKKMKDILITSGSGFTVLSEAAHMGQREVVQILLDAFKNVDRNHKAIREGWNLAFEARRWGIVSDFIKWGMDVNTECEGRDPPMSVLIRCHQDKLVRLLIEHGFDVTRRDYLKEALTAGTLDIARLLHKNGAMISFSKNNDVFRFLRGENWHKRSLEMLDFIVELGIDVDSRNRAGDTALIQASLGKDTIVLKRLLELNVDVNAVNIFGYNALLNAAMKDDLEAIRILVNSGAKINHQANDGNTPILFAVQNGNVDMVQFLIEKGADVNVIDNYGHSPLVWAMYYKNNKIVELLRVRKPIISDLSDHSRHAFLEAENGNRQLINLMILVDPRTYLWSRQKFLKNFVPNSDKTDTIKFLMDYFKTEESNIRGFSTGGPMQLNLEIFGACAKAWVGVENWNNVDSLFKHMHIVGKDITDLKAKTQPNVIYKGLYIQVSSLINNENYEKYLEQYQGLAGPSKSCILRSLEEKVTDPGVIPFYKEMFETGDNGNKYASIRGLANVRDRLGNPVLLQLMKQNPDDTRVASFILYILVKNGYRGADIYPVIDRLFSIGDEITKISIMKTSIELNEKRVKKYIEDALKDRELRSDALIALEKMKFK